MELGSNIENNLNNFKFVFNEKEGWSRSDEPKQKASFSVIDGSDITLYESRLTTKEAREKILKNLNGVNTKRVFEIVEPDIIYNFYLFEDKIVAAFEKPKNCIIISGLKLLDRYKNISRYSVCATTYPKIIDALYEDFSLKNLYNAYINGDDNEKEIMKEFIKLLNFEKKKQTQNFKDLILLAEKQDLFNNMFYPTKRNQKMKL